GMKFNSSNNYHMLSAPNMMMMLIEEADENEEDGSEKTTMTAATKTTQKSHSFSAMVYEKPSLTPSRVRSNVNTSNEMDSDKDGGIGMPSNGITTGGGVGMGMGMGMGMRMGIGEGTNGNRNRSGSGNGGSGDGSGSGSGGRGRRNSGRSRRASSRDEEGGGGGETESGLNSELWFDHLINSRNNNKTLEFETVQEHPDQRNVLKELEAAIFRNSIAGVIAVLVSIGFLFAIVLARKDKSIWTQGWAVVANFVRYSVLYTCMTLTYRDWRLYVHTIFINFFGRLFFFQSTKMNITCVFFEISIFFLFQRKEMPQTNNPSIASGKKKKRYCHVWIIKELW
ncbi:GPI-anchored protein of unknown function, partial [Reticulomyxa filosa]